MLKRHRLIAFFILAFGVVWLIPALLLVLTTNLGMALKVHSLFYPLVECPAQPLDGSSWVCFQYNNAGKGVMYMPVRFDGWDQSLLMQVDLGAPRTMLYEQPLQQINTRLNPPIEPAGQHLIMPTISVDTVRVHGWLGNTRLENARLTLKKNYGDKLGLLNHPKIGTVGLDIFKDKVLVIDFPRQWLAIFEESEEVPQKLMEQATWVHARIEEDKFIFPVRVNGIEMEVFYDTGGGRTPFKTTYDTWKELTGRQGDEKDNITFESRSWGKDVKNIGAPALGNLEIGNFSFTTPLISYVTPVYQWLDMSNYPTEAIVSNNLFVEGHILIFDLIDLRLGIVESTQ